MIHIIVGHDAASRLEAAFELDDNLKGDILVLEDTLGIGPLRNENDLTFSELRTDFWKRIHSGIEELVEDVSRLRNIIQTAEKEEEPLCIWLAPCVSDFCAYYWLLPFFKSRPGMLHTINIVGLPFLNEKGQLFYPRNFSEVAPREFVKTKRLLKEVSVSEFEIDGDEWERMVDENAMVRIYDGGKKIVSKPDNYFDHLLLNAASQVFVKASKVVNEAQKRCSQTLSHFFLEWRLRELIQSGIFVCQGDMSKPLKDFEVKKQEEKNPLSDAQSLNPVG